MTFFQIPEIVLVKMFRVLNSLTGHVLEVRLEILSLGWFQSLDLTNSGGLDLVLD